MESLMADEGVWLGARIEREYLVHCPGFVEVLLLAILLLVNGCTEAAPPVKEWFQKVDDKDSVALQGMLQKEPKLINAKDQWGSTALDRFIEQRDIKLVELGLNHGANPNSDGGTRLPPPLHGAAWANRIDIMQMLLEHGADVDLQDWRNGHGTALHFASLGGRSEAVEFLLKQGADPEGKSPPDQPSPLYWAAALEPQVGAERHRVIELLLKAGADPRRPSSLSPPAWTPLQHAQELEKWPEYDRELVRLLEHD